MIILLLSFVLQAHATAPLPPYSTAKYQACTQDSDCVYASNGSCDCNNGGAPISVNKNQLDAFKKNFDKTDCPQNQGAQCDWGHATCQQALCDWVPSRAPTVNWKKKK